VPFGWENSHRQDSGPAHFIAFIFELWATQPKQHERKFSNAEERDGQFQGSGGLPFAEYIVDCGDALLQDVGRHH